MLRLTLAAVAVLIALIGMAAARAEQREEARFNVSIAEEGPLTAPELRDAAVEAAEAWNSLGTLAPRITVGSYTYAPWDCRTTQGWGTIGWGSPNLGGYCGGDIRLNSEARWWETIDLTGILVHEFGHSLGLPHPPRALCEADRSISVMCRSARQPTEYDRDSLNALYGVRGSHRVAVAVN